MFIGLKKIARAPEERDTVTIYYEDGSTEVMDKKLFDLSKTDHPTDPTALRDRQMQPVARDILLVLFDWNVKVLDYDFVDSLVRTSLNEHMRAAEEKLWGKERTSIRMKDVNKVKKQ